MSTSELQNILIERIKSLEDDTLLKEMLALIDSEVDENEIYKLSPEQREAINEARLQVLNGQHYTNEEVDREINQWLNE